MCDQAEELWANAGFPLARTANGSWLADTLARSATAAEAEAVLTKHRAAGVNVLITCTYETTARLLIAGMEGLNYSVFAFIASASINEAFVSSVAAGWWQGARKSSEPRTRIL